MAIEEIKEEPRKLRVPTPERPVYQQGPHGDVFRYDGTATGIWVVRKSEPHLLFSRDQIDRFDEWPHDWKCVRPTFEPCEPEYEPVELKPPFVRRWDGGAVIAYHSMGGDGNWVGHQVGQQVASGFKELGGKWFRYSTKDILPRSTPVRITGPTRKPAEVRYPALYRDEDGHEWVAKSEALCLCIDPHSVRFGHHGHSEDGHPAADVQDLELVTDHPDFPQPAGEWELPFAVKGADTWIAYAKNGDFFNCVNVNNGRVQRYSIFHGGTLEDHWQPTTIG